MPITAFSREAQAELDLEQWLERNHYPVEDDPRLERMPPELRTKASSDIECSGCRARGAMLVRTGRQGGVGRGVSQGHFRFGEAGGANPHHPPCDFYDDCGPRETAYSVNFANKKSPLTKLVRDLVCRGIRAGLFGQGDIRAMRLWFLEARTEHAVELGITADDLKWCADMDRMRVWSADDIPFRPEHGRIPGFDFEHAARREWLRGSRRLVEGRGMFVFFHGDDFQRAIKLIEHHGKASVLDPTALREKYEAVMRLAGFMAVHLSGKSGTRLHELLKRNP